MALALRLGRQPRRGHLRPARPGRQANEALRLFHAKDGDRTDQPPSVGNGYNIIPFGDPRSDIDFETFFKNMGAKGYHNANYEQDNAPGGSADPEQSLRHATISAHNMLALRG